MSMKRFDIRVELPGGELQDHAVFADDIEGAKVHMDRTLRRTMDVQFTQWRGAVVFVNRAVPLCETPLRVMR